jgi:Patatin-like phospholipase
MLIRQLDGGGVRGYSTLIILQELMHRTFVEIHGRAPKRSEIPKPCDHFDLIVGTGTGGLIALMLGRLRMNIETCKDTYVRLTKRVFETDKTIAGIPYRSTLFKASKLEEAIRECVREHTVFEYEGNDQGDDPPYDPNSPRSPVASTSSVPHRTLSGSSRYSQIGVTPITDFRGPYAAARWGKPNALLYDARETRTKTQVTYPPDVFDSR